MTRRDLVVQSLTVEIPGEIVEALRLPPQDALPRLRLELAVALYAQNILGAGKSAELASMSRLEFDDEVARRHVPMHYDPSDLGQDLAYARGGQ
jgi:predicted HTH domain antitoxin